MDTHLQDTPILLPVLFLSVGAGLRLPPTYRAKLRTTGELGAGY